MQPGDFVRIDVWRQPDLSGEYAIGPDSALVHPLYQHVVVGGLTLPEAREQIGEFLRTFQQDVRFVVEPLRRVTVSGEVRQPTTTACPWNRRSAVGQPHRPSGGSRPVALHGWEVNTW